MESQPQNPENFHLCNKLFTEESKQKEQSGFGLFLFAQIIPS